MCHLLTYLDQHAASPTSHAVLMPVSAWVFDTKMQEVLQQYDLLAANSETVK